MSEQSSADDIKAKMKEALERKHAAERAGQAHLDGHGKAERVHDKTGGPERFQRKSG